MVLTPEESKEQISQLVANYKHSTDDERQRLSEADVQASYIDRLFLALGWNVYNDPNRETAYHRQGYIRGAGIVDVGMEILGKPVLMQEAKRFGIIGESSKRTSDRTLEEKQVFRYARGRGIPHAILSNFERTLVFNADHERLILSFDSPDEYLSRVEDLLLLSPDKIKSGSLQWIERQTGIKDVDEAFLASMRGWRLKLANAIYQHNAGNPVLQTDGSFDFHKLMMVVQRILDRLMLIRYADDKEVLLVFDILDYVLADYRKRGPYAKPDHLMQQFIDLSQMMDQHHNTKLFQPGHICEKVNIPNDVLATVMEEMNNISFRKFTSDILGATYESYLATKLVLKNGEIVSQEQKETRKKGGIYYTPSWVVHYIVDNTLGKLLNELEAQHGIKAIEKAAEIRVLDPACGSGSFLIYAYQVFANFYRKMNKAIDDERVKLITPVAGPDMFQRMEILKNTPEPVIDYPQYILSKHLYGVDIDPEAAEIAAVNLTMTAFADSRKEKLPLILDENIKVGNSLISGAEEELKKYFGDAWRDKRPFNWEEEFPDIMQRGGFDVVVGNPPYIDSESMVNSGQTNLREAIQKAYTMAKGNWDIYIAFFELGFKVMRENGILSFITPDKWISKPFGDELRRGTIDNIFAILKAGREIFEGSNVDSIISFFSKGHYQTLKIFDFEDNKVILKREVNKESLKSPFALDYLFSNHLELLLKIDVIPNKVLDFSSCENACATSDAYKLEPLVKNSSNGFDLNNQLKIINTGTIGKYFLKWGNSEMTYLKHKYLYPVVDKKEFFSLFKNSYVKKSVLSKIIIKGLNLLDACLDIGGNVIPGKSTLIIASNDIEKLKLLLSILNSKLAFFYIKERYPASSYNKGTNFTKEMINNLPVPKMTENEQKPFINLVDNILSLTTSTDYLENKEKQAKVEEYERQIDQMVYDLYGLTEEERRVVEGEII